MQKKLYKTIVQVEILSEEPYEAGSLSDMSFDTTEGDCSAHITTIEDRVIVTGKDAVKECGKHGSDTEFFQMDEDGNEMD